MRFFCLLVFLMAFCFVKGEDGYRLWLRYEKIDNPAVLKMYSNKIRSFSLSGHSPTLRIAKEELSAGLNSLLGTKIPDTQADDASIIIFTKTSGKTHVPINYDELGKEGFIIRSFSRSSKSSSIAISANTDIGILYGVFHFLRLLQTHSDIRHLQVKSVPAIQNRILNHWDNLNRTVERGYAGISIWNWHTLPDLIDQRYIDYARANASIGINGTVLTNVNSNALVLSKAYLTKVAALADLFRPYGIRVFLTARFSAPVEAAELKSADPPDEQVQKWWNHKADTIYKLIPDFGGFLVKANSEGQPGPQNYGRTHADGANMLARALKPHGGIVMWRTFVYSQEADDRFSQALNEFIPLDSQFLNNVLLQVKNGPIDFQPREPFSPIFGHLPNTPLMLEFQITQEYVGQGTHLFFQAPLYKETLDEDTYEKGEGSCIAKRVDGTLRQQQITAIAGVSNIGNEKNWTLHPFGQANWYAYGRLAWDYQLSSKQIAEEWVRQTFNNELVVVKSISKIMLTSREAVVNYMTPLGLHHLMGTNHHYGPAPWVNNAGRADWNPVYYHRVDSFGIGFDRTKSGSNALEQYAPEVRQRFENIKTCPEEYLLWFHHVPWDYKMESGKSLWDELCTKYYSGVNSVRWMQQEWQSMSKYIDKERFVLVKMLLDIQLNESVWWRNACLLFFQTYSRKPIPFKEQPDHTLNYYQSLNFPLAPGIGGNN
jgi:alpha-glucuronidase